MTFDQLHRDAYGQVGVTYRRDFLVGPDSALIRMRQKFGRRGFGNFLLDPRDVDLDDVVALGLAGHTHLIDCSDDDPLNFRFAHYGAKARVLARRSFQGQRIAEASWAALRSFGATDYGRIKSSGEPDLVDVSYVLCGKRTSYRRLAVPLSSDGRKVSHLLVGMRMHEVEIPLGTGDHVVPGVLRGVDPLPPAGRPELPVDQQAASVRAIGRR